MNTLNVSIVTPNGEIYKGEDISMVVADTTNGQMGIMANHIPMVSSLKIGKLKLILTDEKELLFATSDGFLETHGNEVTVMVQTAESSDNIDVKRAEEAKVRAEERLSKKDPNIDVRRAEFALKRALARLDVSNK